MNLIALATSLVLIFSATAPIDAAVSRISKIESLAQIQVSQPEKTIFFFDIDDTLLDFPHMLGSKAWRRYLDEATKQIDPSKNWHDTLTFLLAQKYPTATVEPLTSQFVKDLQKKGYVVCGLTGRERKIWYYTPQEGVDRLTQDQLLSVDINFNNNSLENAYPHLAIDSEYFNGTFFANIDPKGNYLLHIFNNAPELPAKVIFIDDKLNQVESVAKAMTELGIDSDCYFYYATEVRTKNFNPLIANIQFYYFIMSDYQDLISDQEAAAIAEADPAKDAEHYLKAILESEFIRNMFQVVVKDAARQDIP